MTVPMKCASFRCIISRTADNPSILKRMRKKPVQVSKFIDGTLLKRDFASFSRDELLCFLVRPEMFLDILNHSIEALPTM